MRAGSLGVCAVCHEPTVPPSQPGQVQSSRTGPELFTGAAPRITAHNLSEAALLGAGWVSGGLRRVPRAHRTSVTAGTGSELPNRAGAYYRRSTSLNRSEAALAVRARSMGSGPRPWSPPDLQRNRLLFEGASPLSLIGHIFLCASPKILDNIQGSSRCLQPSPG